MLELSYAKASTFRGCQKKYYWKYKVGLIPIKKTSALSLGSILHAGFDMFFKGGGDTFVYDFIANTYDKLISAEEVADREDILIDKYTALGMWLYYPYKKEQYDQHFSEEAFSVPLSPSVTFVGKVDGRVMKAGNWWIRELKTTGMNIRQFEGRCQTSAQGTGYVFGLSKKYEIKGILYDYVKKPILRKGIRETADDFGRRIMKDYHDRPKLYYDLYYSYRSPTDITNFEQDTAYLAADIIDKINRDVYYRNCDQCWNYGTECPYLKICFDEHPDPLTLQLYYTTRGGDDNGRERE